MSLLSPARIATSAALALAALTLAPAAEAKGGPADQRSVCLAGKSAVKRPSPVRTCRRAGKAPRALPARTAPVPAPTA